MLNLLEDVPVAKHDVESSGAIGQHAHVLRIPASGQSGCKKDRWSQKFCKW